jgi:hypothetical protein
MEHPIQAVYYSHIDPLLSKGMKYFLGIVEFGKSWIDTEAL